MAKATTVRKPRVRRSYRQLFLDALEKQSQGEQTLIANQVLRDALGWEDALYRRIKGELVSEREIIVGRGRGGSVGLASAPGEAPAKALQIFVSYSHQDEKMKDELIKHLSPLKRLNLIDAWHDRKISAGDKWDVSISDALQSADIILLLVSIDFINSKYCYDIEMESALQRERVGDVVVIPVIARNCMWKTTEFARLQATPTDGKAIASWPDQDEALTTVAERVREVAERLMAER
ncbi:toll/interleukin-1 receptor domain-containing protein [Sphingobium terrigena]|nr:toll/interleukin-1 receptor domain-containing protein [Sphingobium terrigena]